MLFVAEEFAVPRNVEDVGIGVDAAFVQFVGTDQRVADFVRGIAELDHNLFAAAGDTAQTDREAVAGHDREQDADCASAELLADVGRDLIDRGVVALRAGDDGLRDADHVAVAQRKAFACGSSQNAVCDDGGEIVAFADDRAADAAGDGTDETGLIVHNDYPFQNGIRTAA